MIVTFKHRGLERFFTRGNKRGIQPEHANRLRMQLTALNTASELNDLDIPGYDLHQLAGNRQNIWSIKVNGNWRLTFEFIDGNVHILNYEDYH